MRIPTKFVLVVGLVAVLVSLCGCDRHSASGTPSPQLVKDVQPQKPVIFEKIAVNPADEASEQVPPDVLLGRLPPTQDLECYTPTSQALQLFSWGLSIFGPLIK